VRQVEQALVAQVDEAARGADDDLRTGLELVDLALVGLAAVDRDDARRAVRGEHVHVLVDLDGELAGRHDDERLDARRGSRPRRWTTGMPKPKVLPVPVLA
jgi:hypothetical protein